MQAWNVEEIIRDKMHAVRPIAISERLHCVEPRWVIESLPINVPSILALARRSHTITEYTGALRPWISRRSFKSRNADYRFSFEGWFAVRCSNSDWFVNSADVKFVSAMACFSR
jgi:hypothetical protein